MILITKTNILNVYMNIQFHRVMASSPINLLDICVFLFLDIMIVKYDFLQNLNQASSSFSSRAFFIVLQEL